MSVSCLVLKEKFYGDCAASGAVSTLLMYTFLDQGKFKSRLFLF